MARLRSSGASSTSATASPSPDWIGNRISSSRSGLRKTTRDQTKASLIKYDRLKSKTNTTRDSGTQTKLKTRVVSLAEKFNLTYTKDQIIVTCGTRTFKVNITKDQTIGTKKLLPYTTRDIATFGTQILQYTTRDQTTACSGTKKLLPYATRNITFGKKKLTPAKFHNLADHEVDSPFIYPVLLDIEQLQLWGKFKYRSKDVKVLPALRYRVSKFDTGGDFGEDLDPRAGICKSLTNFAVETFNNSYQLFVRKKIFAAIKDTSCLKCFYYKLRTKYHFFMKLAGVEDGFCRVYDVAVTCDPDDGARTLIMFRFGRGQLGESAESLPSEPKEDVPLTPVDLYEASGLLRRGFIKGHDFYNPDGMERINFYGGAKQNLKALMQYK